MRPVELDIALLPLAKPKGNARVVEVNAESVDIEYGGRLRYPEEEIIESGRLGSDVVDGGRLGANY